MGIILAIRHGGGGMKMVELNESGAGRAVTLVAGERLRVKLEEAGTTGYRWRVGTECGMLLHLEEDRWGAPGDAPGASVGRTWIYRAEREGRCELRFESARSWEKTATGKTVIFPVTVHGAS